MGISKSKFIKPIGLSRKQIDKLGNTIIYLCKNVPSGLIYKTKLLKLVYLLEETYIKNFGLPFFDLEYKVWQAGPVNVDLYAELSSDLLLLKDFINVNSKEESADGCKITPCKDFDDSEFSDHEIETMDQIIREFGNKSGGELVNITHANGTLWETIANQNNLLEEFKKGTINITDFTIDFTPLLTGSFKEKYLEQKEYLQYSKLLNKS